jgi:predicted phosphoribosyltransferase
MAKIIDSVKLREKIHIFKDREHAGSLLAEKLTEYRENPETIIIAIPAGGIPVGYQISLILELPFEVAITRKLHVPWNKEVGFGAVTWNDLVEVNRPLVIQLGLTERDIEEVIEKEKKVITQRRNDYNRQEFPDLVGKHAILVDDGLASGFSMLTTVKAVKLYKPIRITVAVPTAPLSSIERLRPHVDQIFCLNIRSGMYFAVASAYKNWYDLTDREVIKYLRLSKSQS